MPPHNSSEGRVRGGYGGDALGGCGAHASTTTPRRPLTTRRITHSVPLCGLGLNIQRKRGSTTATTT